MARPNLYSAEIQLIGVGKKMHRSHVSFASLAHSDVSNHISIMTTIVWRDENDDDEDEDRRTQQQTTRKLYNGNSWNWFLTVLPDCPGSNNGSAKQNICDSLI